MNIFKDRISAFSFVTVPERDLFSSLQYCSTRPGTFCTCRYLTILRYYADIAPQTFKLDALYVYSVQENFSILWCVESRHKV